MPSDKATYSHFDADDNVASDSDDLHGGSCRGPKRMMWDFLSVYQVPKVIKVRSPMLKVPKLICDCMILLIIAAYAFIFKLRFLKPTGSLGIAVVSLTPPLVNFWDCKNIEIDCSLKAIDVNTLPYCRPNASMNLSGCDFVDRHLVSPLIYTKTIFIATARNEIIQRKQNFAIANKTWYPTSYGNAFIPGIERYMLMIRHSFASPACERGCSNLETQGFLEMRDGSLKRLPCRGTCGRKTDPDQYSPSWHQIPDCGTPQGNANPGGADDTCTSSSWGDYISVGQMLEAANVSLDTADPKHNGWPKRLIGTAIVMSIIMENDDPKEFWLPITRVSQKYKYKYRFREVPMEGAASNRFTKVTRVDKKTRKVMQLMGMPIMVQTEGDLRVPSLLYGVIGLLVFFTAVKMSNVFVEMVMLKMYSCCTRYDHLEVMFSHFTEDETPEDHRFREAVNARDAAEITALEQDIATAKAQKTVDTFELEDGIEKRSLLSFDPDAKKAS